MKKIALITDTHLEEDMPFLTKHDALKQYIRVLSDIHERDITDILFLGDIGSRESHTTFFDALNTFSYTVVAGNHDNSMDLCRRIPLSHSSEEFYYFFDNYGYRCIIMDSSKGNVSQEQVYWLKSAVQECRLPLLIYIHHPLLKIKTTVDTLYSLENRMDIIPILMNAPTPCTVFCGHYHMNDEQVYGNIRQIITSAVSYQIQKDAEGVQIDTSMYGYRIIELFESSVLTHSINFESGK